MEKLLSIGKILNFHGVNGEVKVGYTEGSEHFLTEVSEMHVEKDSKSIVLTVEKIRFHKKFAIVKFKEINSINEVLEFKGGYLKVLKSRIIGLLDKDEFCVDDLVGLIAYDTEGKEIGKVSGVSLSKGQDLLFIKDAFQKEHIIPFTKEIVPDVNIKEKKIIIKNIEGLVETK